MSLIINYVAGSFFFTVQVIPACENKDLSQTPAKETQVVTAHTHDVQTVAGGPNRTRSSVERGGAKPADGTKARLIATPKPKYSRKYLSKLNGLWLKVWGPGCGF